MENTNFIDTIYITDTGTALAKNESNVMLTSVEIESGKYSNAKPKRILLKASIVHDKG